ncbi:MAG: hypothetical protein JWM95_1200 [Gemmatimonadetes bacterium]|nr:hypothetical protein [Gemmatimonadota bacterium]
MDNILGLQMMDEDNAGSSLDEMRSTWSVCCSCTTDSTMCTYSCDWDCTMSD